MLGVLEHPQGQKGDAKLNENICYEKEKQSTFSRDTKKTFFIPPGKI